MKKNKYMKCMGTHQKLSHIWDIKDFTYTSYYERYNIIYRYMR